MISHHCSKQYPVEIGSMPSSTKEYTGVLSYSKLNNQNKAPEQFYSAE